MFPASLVQRLPALSQRFVRHRTFVSSVLFTKTWENESVTDLRKEARSRGLSPKGNKSTLVTRIQEYEKLRAFPEPSLSTPSRSASTVSISPGIPPPSQPTGTLPEGLFRINLPDLSQQDPDPEIQVPYLPDFSKSKPVTASQAVDPPLPKLLLVTGADTHHGGGPSSNLHDEHSHVAYLTDSHIVPSHTATSSHTTDGLLQDVVRDIGIPITFNVNQARKVIADMFAQTTRNDRYVGRSRKLDEEEARGVWVLLGLLTGSYILAGFVNGKPASPKDKDAI